jgi:hypothetical protein
MPSLPAHVRLPSRVPASPPCSRLASPRLASPALPTRCTVTWPVSAVAKAWGSCRCRPAAVGAMRCDAVHSHHMQCGVACCVVVSSGEMAAVQSTKHKASIYPKRPGATKSGWRVYASPYPRFVRPGWAIIISAYIAVVLVHIHLD